jgi:hypothetical protein
MRIVVLYRPESEFARRTEEYITDFQRFHPSQNMEAFNVDSIEGSEIAKLYGVMEYPTILALKDDGQMEQMWSGIEKLPLMNDLAYYAQQ